ncbi:MAG TPA: 30S ribosome-binding factor RbfA [Rhizomicrobium sp.]|nr:30S ribosome-binding factor RbfA [Rhizomicrobium sp.]
MHERGAERTLSQRQLRVGEMLRHALADILRRSEIRDPDLSGVSVTVTQVKPSPDMRHATAFVEPLGGQKAKEVIAALNRHKGFIRGEIGHLIALKFTPEFRFVEDTSFAEAQRIETLLKSSRVAADLNEGDEGDQEEDVTNQDAGGDGT